MELHKIQSKETQRRRSDFWRSKLINVLGTGNQPCS